jgi:hypothetical protein
LVRKTISFSKKRERLEKQLHLAFAYYHFVKPHLGLKQEIIDKNKKCDCSGAPGVNLPPGDVWLKRSEAEGRCPGRSG